MDFRAMMAAVDSGDVDGFLGGLADDPGLATARPGGAPSLLQYVVVNGGLGRVPRQLEFVGPLVEAGADLEPPFVAAASVGNVAAGQALLAAGATPGGVGPWAPLDEALYWRASGFVELLLDRGVVAGSLRSAAGLGDPAGMAPYFLPSGAPRPDQVIDAWPFGALPSDQRSDDPGDVLAAALVAAATNCCEHALRDLAARGAPLDRIPPGTHHKGTALHAAVWRGGRFAVRALLELGADPAVRDGENDATPLGWARHLGKEAEAEVLEAAGAPG